MKTRKNITYAERIKIETLYNKGYKVKEICKELNISEITNNCN